LLTVGGFAAQMSSSVQSMMSHPCQATAHVSTVCILCCRGQGVGSAVVKHLLETPATITTDVYLVTLGRSIPFYKKAGFTVVPVKQIPRYVLFSLVVPLFVVLLVCSFAHSNWCNSPRLNYIQSCLLLFLAACTHMRAAAGEMHAAEMLLAI
jgi:hypothetical protein